MGGRRRREEGRGDQPDRAGEELGWRRYEGRESFNNPEGAPPILHAEPVFTYGHDAGNCSITGGYVYRGKAIPALAGRYVFTDFCSGRLWALRRADGNLVADVLATIPGNPSSFGEDAAGELYLTSFEGANGATSTLYKILPQ